MSYDRRRLRDHHPTACTCVDCKEGRRKPPRQREPTQSESSSSAELKEPVWPPRSLSPGSVPSHPRSCQCSECEGKRGVDTQRSRPVVPPVQLTPPEKLSTKKPVFMAPVRLATDRGARGQDGSSSTSRVVWKLVWPMVLIIAIAGGIWWWQGSSADSSAANNSAQVAESGGGWFSFDCDNERRRRRGGWLKALIC